MVSDRTPIIVGAAQLVERLDASDYAGLPAAGLAARAARLALDDIGIQGVAQLVDAIGAIRTFEDSMPLPAPFGKPANFPRAVARRLGITPRIARLERAGGQSPLDLIANFADRIASGDIDVAIVAGSEAISSTRHLKSQGEVRDWAEESDGDIEDVGAQTASMMRRSHAIHKLHGAPPAYALLEQARRARLGLSRQDYAAEMGRLFAPFTGVAASNPNASAAIQPMSPEELVTPTDRNRIVAEPYTVKLVSRDQVNQAASLVLMSVGKARELGISEGRWIFLHGCALAGEPDLIERPDLGASPAAKMALEAALGRSGKRVADMRWLDFYSCFPIPVFMAAVDVLGLSPDDPRGLTVTGGLPYFGGPGNNYSMHAFAEMARLLRAEPGSFGLIGLNGGVVSKYGAAVLSTEPAEWRGCLHDGLQEELDALPRPAVAHSPQGWARIVTYTVIHGRGGPSVVVVIGELDDGRRFIANNVDAETLERAVAEDLLGQRIYVATFAAGNRFGFDRNRVHAAMPRVRALRDDYEHILVERRGPVLEVTINRAEARNSLPPAAHFEMGEVFDLFEADPTLWVAILTGAGDKAFCAGADLKALAGGVLGPDGAITPLSGFGGLTSRVHRTKPVIAAVNGIAFGGGTEISLACDLVVADPAAMFGLTEVRVGLLAGAGGAVRLPRQLPRKIALEMLLTGRHLSAAEGAHHGLVNRVSEAGKVMDEARRLADEICSVSPTSVRLTMQVVQEADASPDADIAAVEALQSTAIDRLFVSEDMAEGVAAFAQKRPPRWTNR